MYASGSSTPSSNYPIVLYNFQLAEAPLINRLLDEALEFYNDPKVRALDGEQFDFPELIEELNYDVWEIMF